MTQGLALHRDWVCAKDCGSSARTYDSALPHHPCKAMAGLMVPLILAGTKAKVEAQPRQDYVGKEVVQRDADGRVWMSTLVTRDEGQDCSVYAPTALGKRE